MNKPIRNPSAVHSFLGKTEDGSPLTGFQTTENTLNVRLGFLSVEDGRLCTVAVTDMDSGEGLHITLTTDSLRDLVEQFASEVGRKLESHSQQG